MDKTKIRILIIIAIIVILVIIAMAINKKAGGNSLKQVPMGGQEEPFENEGTQYDQFYDPNDPNLPMPPTMPQSKLEVKTIDVMAPGYNEAQKRINNVREKRNQAINQQQKDLENFE